MVYGHKHTHNFHNAVTLMWGSLRLTPNHYYMLFCTVGYNRECLVSSFSNWFMKISGKSYKGKFPQYTHWVEATCSFFSFISRYPATRKQPKSDQQMSNVWTRLKFVSTHTLNTVRLVFWFRLSAYVSVWVHMLSSAFVCMCLYTRICMWHFRD